MNPTERQLMINHPQIYIQRRKEEAEKAALLFAKCLEITAEWTLIPDEIDGKIQKVCSDCGTEAPEWAFVWKYKNMTDHPHQECIQKHRIEILNNLIIDKNITIILQYL